MERKYEFVENDRKTLFGKILYRIKALKSFVNEAIQSEISAGDEAMVFGKAVAHDNAMVYGEARAYENAEVLDHTAYLVDLKNWVTMIY